jgi:hypothetical protein
MKFSLVPVVFALVVPLAACTGNKSVSSSSVQSPTAQSAPSPETTSASASNNWYKYTAKDGSYSASFPGQPQEKDQSVKTQVGELKFSLTSYGDNASKRAYATTSAKYPVKPSEYDVEKGLDGARDGQAKNTNATITNEKKISLNGFSGREITLKGANGGAMKTRLFIDPKGPTLYQALVVAEDGNLNFPEADTFLNSLALPK